MNEEDKSKILSDIKDSIQDVLKINYKYFPNNMHFIEMPIEAWVAMRRDIVKEVIKHANLNIQINGGFGGGLKKGFKIIGIQKYGGLPAIKEEDMERNIDELLALDRG